MTAQVRSVTVRLEADVASYMAKMKMAGVATDQAFSRAQSNVAATNRELTAGQGPMRNYGTEARSTATALSSVDQHTVSLGRNAATAGPQIDRLSGRLRIFADLAAILGPGLLPLAAVGAPALAGMAASAGALAIAGGSVVVAFQGVGGALKAVQDYKLDPTAANLERAQEALALIGPDATAFVARFQQLRPVLRDIRDSAAAGWFPGLTEALDSFEDAAPRIERLFERVGEAGGAAIAAGAESLAGERWRPFMRFLTNEAPSAITDLSRIVGDLAHGAAEMWMSFDPSNDAFLDWVGDVADGFDDWASSEQGRQDIASFLGYVRETGPQVLDFFVATVNMLTQVSQAAAPLGGPVLASLTAVANVIGAIADSDLGTPIFTGIAALALYNRALQTTAALSKSAFGQAAAGQKASGIGGFLGGQLESSRKSLKAFRNDLQVLNPAYAAAATRSERLSVATKSLSTNFRSLAGGAARVAGPVAGMALVTSSLGDNLGLTNTASLALMGSFAGPWGTAVGTAVGFTLDMVAANKKVAESTEEWNAALAEQSTSLGGTNKVLEDARKEYEKFADDVDNDSLGESLRNGLDPDYLLNGIEGFFGKSNVEEKEEALRKLEDKAKANITAFTRLGEVFGADLTGSQIKDTAQLQIALERAKPAMDELELSLEDLQAIQLRSQQGGLEGLVGGLQMEGTLAAIADESARLARETDSLKGRMADLAGAFDIISDPAKTAAESADALRTSLDALLDPALDAEAATHAWRAALAELRSELDSDFGFSGLTEEGRANAAVTRDYVAASKERLVAMAAEGASEEELAAAVAATRREFVESGIAAGFSRKEITARADALGLTPKLIRTVFEAAGIDIVTLRAKEALRAFNALPKNVRTDVKENGIPQTMAKVNALVDKYELTEKERQALITLMDHASPGIRGILKLIDNVRDKEVTITTYVDTVRRNFGTSPVGDSGNPYRDAMGGIHQNNVRTYARGGMDRRNSHWPELAGPGPTRVWREPETKGESYIPHANDHRRPRAKSVLEQTAGMFGGQVQWFANGGFSSTSGANPLNARFSAALLNDLRSELDEMFEDYRARRATFLASERPDRPEDLRAELQELEQDYRQRRRAFLTAEANKPDFNNQGRSNNKSGRSAQEMLEILEALSTVRGYKRELAATGKDALNEQERRLVELRLKVAEKEYRLAKTREEREELQKNRERLQGARSNLQAVGQGFSLDSIVPGPALTIAQGVSGEIAQFRRDIRAAGGTWSNSLQRWARDLVETARELDQVNASIVAETAHRDQLVAALNDEQQALDQLTSTMESYANQVASSLLKNPFNQSGSTAAASPELDAARAELAAIRASATGDSAASAARAEQLIHQIAQLGGATGSEGGLAAFDATVAANTQAARDMRAALETLMDKGLDTTGPLGALYAELAASSDVLTAQQLAALTIEEIDARERAFAESQNEAAATAALATQARYGADQAVLVSSVARMTEAVAASDATLFALNATAASLGAEVRAGAREGVAGLQTQIDKLARAIDDLPDKIVVSVKKRGI